MPKRSHSELECFVLGLVWQLGPCSPYDVRRALLDSPSTQWSGSAGAIYPLMARLQRAGLLRAKQEKGSGRAKRTFCVTAAGLAALKAWIGPPLADDAVTVSYDPLRSRARFLGVLSADERRAWAGAAEAALGAVEEKVKRWQERYGPVDELLALITRHGELDLAMRRAWLAEVRRVIR
ncbi:MAG: PadR family transcriptional regulator [Planctomycetes bacterium]|nr:PadR family transcriptional regulator [Planctomycetota bacterium]